MFGQDEANHGTVRHRVGLDDLVLVPPEVALNLANNGGFAVIKPIAMGRSKPRPGDLQCNALVGLHHDTAGACSYGGSKYRADKNGDFFVPAEAVADLTAHGFMPIQPEGARQERVAEPVVKTMR
ncbi:MAG: hypothetical protein WB611_15520 [Stellaceae bacterium]